MFVWFWNVENGRDEMSRGESAREYAKNGNEHMQNMLNSQVLSSSVFFAWQLPHAHTYSVPFAFHIVIIEIFGNIMLGLLQMMCQHC